MTLWSSRRSEINSATSGGDHSLKQSLCAPKLRSSIKLSISGPKSWANILPLARNPSSSNVFAQSHLGKHCVRFSRAQCQMVNAHVRGHVISGQFAWVDQRHRADRLVPGAAPKDIRRAGRARLEMGAHGKRGGALGLSRHANKAERSNH